MPITQSRLHRLLTAAEAATINLQHLLACTHQQATELRGQLPTLQEAYDRLKAAYDTITNEITIAAQLSPAHTTAIAEERMHYRLTHHQNDYKRAQLARRRRRMGIPEAPLPKPISAAPPMLPRSMQPTLTPNGKTIQQIAAEVLASDEALQGLESGLGLSPTDPPLDPADDPTQPIPGWEALRAELGLAPSAPQEGD